MWIFGRVQAFYEWSYLFIEDLQFFSYFIGFYPFPKPLASKRFPHRGVCPPRLGVARRAKTNQCEFEAIRNKGQHCATAAPAGLIRARCASAQTEPSPAFELRSRPAGNKAQKSAPNGALFCASL